MEDTACAIFILYRSPRKQMTSKREIETRVTQEEMARLEEECRKSGSNLDRHLEGVYSHFEKAIRVSIKSGLSRGFPVTHCPLPYRSKQVSLIGGIRAVLYSVSVGMRAKVILGVQYPPDYQTPNVLAANITLGSFGDSAKLRRDVAFQDQKFGEKYFSRTA